MILYTIVPYDAIFNAGNDVKYLEMEYLGEKVRVICTPDNRFILDRLLSTSPKSFLDPRFKPGSVIQ